MQSNTDLKQCYFYSADEGCRSYNPTFTICCNGVINSKPVNGAYCDTTAYNSGNHVSCNGVLSSKPFYPACCDTRA